MKKIYSLLTIILCLIVVDTFIAIIFTRSPIIHTRVQELDNDSYVDKGLIIDTFYCTKEKDIQDVSYYIKGHKYSCPVDNEEEVLTEYKIVDKMAEDPTMACAQALEEFYRDDTYKYLFNCIKSDLVVVIYPDGTEIPIKKALENKEITISDLDRFNISYYKEKK